MATRRHGDRNVRLAHEFISKTDIIEMLHLDHQMVDALRAGRSESHRVVAFIAMHEHEIEGAVETGEWNPIFDPTTHPEQLVELIGLFEADRFLLYQMAKPARARLETALHTTARLVRKSVV